MSKATSFNYIAIVLMIACILGAITSTYWPDWKDEWLRWKLGKKQATLQPVKYVDSSQRVLRDFNDLSIPSLYEAFDDDDAAIREEVIVKLRDMGDASASPLLIRALSDSSASVRDQAAEALAELDARVVLPELRSRLHDDDNVVRRSVFHALATMQDDEAVPALLAALEDDDALVRRDAARALKEITGKTPENNYDGRANKDIPSSRHWSNWEAATE